MNSVIFRPAAHKEQLPIDRKESGIQKIKTAGISWHIHRVIPGEKIFSLVMPDLIDQAIPKPS